MKNLFIILIAAVILAGCGAGKVANENIIAKMNSECGKSRSEILGSVARLMIEENYQMKMNDPIGGYAVYTRNDVIETWKAHHTVMTQWEIQVDSNGVLTASAKSILEGSYGKTTATYYTDETDKNYTWYWNIRYGLEEVCGRKMEMIEYEKEDAKPRERKY